MAAAGLHAGAAAAVRNVAAAANPAAARGAWQTLRRRRHGGTQIVEGEGENLFVNISTGHLEPVRHQPVRREQRLPPRRVGRVISERGQGR